MGEGHGKVRRRKRELIENVRPDIKKEKEPEGITGRGLLHRNSASMGSRPRGGVKKVKGVLLSETKNSNEGNRLLMRGIKGPQEVLFLWGGERELQKGTETQVTIQH